MVTIIKMGGGPNPPVKLDPAQTITNVHWGKKAPGYIAFSTQLWAPPGDLYPTPPYPGSSRFEPDYDDWSTFDLMNTGWDYQSETAEDRAISRYVFDGAVWSSTPSIVVNGMPDPVTVAFEPSQWRSTFDFWRWDLTEGGENPAELTIPGKPELPFSYNTSPRAVVQLRPFTAEAEWIRPTVTEGLVRKYAAPVAIALQDAVNEVIDLSGVSIVHEDVTYTPIATAVDMSTGSAGTLLTGTLWVLCAPPDDTA